MYTHTWHPSPEMYEPYLLVVYFGVCLDATHVPSIPSIPPWSSFQYLEQSDIKNFLQIQTFPQYTWLPMELVIPNFASHRAGTQAYTSLQKCLEKSVESSKIRLDRSAKKERRDWRLEWEKEWEKSENLPFKQLWGVPTLV